ncbi:pectinesterase inhibitor 3 [Rosa rugosa]|uniref:pectinesterase inhibitor 3 n=1 Tax=Rosa rugosa TaxID=74645 RepID=UPI002B4172F1|nr:pectinesterase inhibitor 3 [Rosa rugosa]
MRFTLLPLLLLLLLLSYSAAARKPSSHNATTSSHLVRTSCQHASYPNLCLHTLSASPAQTPRDLAQAAVGVSLSRARKVSAFLSQLSHSSSSSSTPKRQRVAVGDCVEQVSDSVDELSRTLEELHHLHEETFRWQMSNAQTWVSAALTNDDTCLDGFQEVDGKVKADVKKKITNAARVTSNALYMINRLDESRGRPRS